MPLVLLVPLVPLVLLVLLVLVPFILAPVPLVLLVPFVTGGAVGYTVGAVAVHHVGAGPAAIRSSVVIVSPHRMGAITYGRGTRAIALFGVARPLDLGAGKGAGSR